MKKSLFAIPVCAAAVAGAALFALKGKKGGESAKPDAPKPAKTAEKKAAPKKPAHETAVTYSFACGYTKPAKVEASFRYDADKFSHDVVEDGFFTTTSVPTVVLLYGEDFQFQMEYGEYYGGEDFAAFSKGVQERYQGFGTVQYGAVSGIKYCDGESMCLCFPASDAEGYVLVTVFNGKGNDEPFTALPDRADLGQILSTLTCKTI